MLPIQRCLLLTLIFHTGLEQPFSLNTVYGVHLGTEMDGMMCLCSSNRITLCITCVVPGFCLLYTSPSPRDATLSRMPSSA